MEKIIAGIFGLVIGAVGIWTSRGALKNRRTLNRWPTTKGRVVERGTYQPNIPYGTAGRFRYAPLVRYVYHVGGQEFVKDSVHPARIQAPFVSGQKWAQEKAASFPDEVTVHYNPEDPSESFLVQTPKSCVYILLGCSYISILFGIMFLLVG